MTLNLHTDGGEFYTLGTTTEYIGYYCIVGGWIFSGRDRNDESVRLIRIPDLVKEYNQVSTTKLSPDVAHFIPMPTPEDYKRGWFNRYFVRQANDEGKPFIEVDETQYGAVTNGSNDVNAPFYIAVTLRWKITGPHNDIIENGKVVEPGVVDTNRRSVSQIANKYPLFAFRLQVLDEYWDGSRPAYFGPHLTEKLDDHNKLNKLIKDVSY